MEWNEAVRWVMATGFVASVFIIGVYVSSRLEVRAWRERAEKAQFDERQAAGVAARELDRKEVWVERAREWREETLRERARYDTLDAEYKDALKRLGPAYLWEPVSLVGGEFQAPETPSVSESDRLEMEERRRRQIREGGFEPVVIGDGDVPPPHRLDVDNDEEYGVPG
jgi:hypothetical protein